MTHDSPEFDAALAVTELKKSKADGIKSLIAAVKASARYQARAEKAEATVDRVWALMGEQVAPMTALVLERRIRTALEEPTP